MTGPKIASELTVSNSEMRVSFQVHSSLPFRLKLRAKVAPLLLYPGVLLGLLSHLCYMRTTFFPLDSKNGSNPVTAEADSFACSVPPG